MKVAMYDPNLSLLIVLSAGIIFLVSLCKILQRLTVLNLFPSALANLSVAHTGFDLYKADPSKYGFSSAFYGSNPYYQNPKFLSPALAAEGGEIVGPGTGTSDSIPAMLSDGEFVMTAKAV